MFDVEGAIATLRLVPVLVINDASNASPLAQALKAGGLPCAEVTFRTAAAEAAICEIARVPEMIVGAGTVVSVGQVDRAIAAGASFIVSPGFSRQVVGHCQERGIPVYPGVTTPTEVQMGLEAGLRTLKFFPAESAGGIRALNAIAGPYSTMRFIPTGGINRENLPAYLSSEAVLAVGGSWMVAPELIDAGRFDAIARLTAEATSMVRRG